VIDHGFGGAQDTVYIYSCSNISQLIARSVVCPWFVTTTMDVIRRLEETEVHEVILPTINAFVPLLNERKAEIEKVERNEFKYGQGDRHYLDVYYPPAASALSTPNKKLPVLFFIYGGGYNSGSRRYPNENLYRALGSFFATRGFLTVIPDYRLVPDVQFPSGSEDVRDALLWVAGHSKEVTSAVTDPASARAELDPGYVFIMGHSAGAAHTFALYSYPPLRASLAEKAVEVGLQVRGVVLNGTPWYFNVTGSEKLFPASGPIYLYLGDEAQQRERESRGLWAALGDDDVRAFPDGCSYRASESRTGSSLRSRTRWRRK